MMVLDLAPGGDAIAQPLTPPASTSTGSLAPLHRHRPGQRGPGNTGGRLLPIRVPHRSTRRRRGLSSLSPSDPLDRPGAARPAPAWAPACELHEQPGRRDQGVGGATGTPSAPAPPRPRNETGTGTTTGEPRPVLSGVRTTSGTTGGEPPRRHPSPGRGHRGRGRHRPSN